MTNCAKCGAELIGSRKFCSTCGAPAVDPATLKRDAGSSPSPGPVLNVPQGAPNSSYGPPDVNPFAATASPASRKVAPVNPAPPPSAYGPPPGGAVPPQEMTPAPQAKASPSNPPGVSPLAVSNALSQRGAFDQVAGQALAAAATAPPPTAAAGSPAPAPPTAAPDPAPAKRNIPGTQIMPSVANPPQGAPASVVASAANPPPPQKQQKGTQVMGMGAFPMSQAQPGGTGSAPPGPTGPSGPSTSAASGPSGIGPVPSAAQPPASMHQPGYGQQHPASVAYGQQPQQQQPSYPYSAQQPQQPQQQSWGGGGGWNQPQQQPIPTPQQPMQPVQPQGYQYGFGYTPGSRVNVTWSNGQRYPATVQQVSGTQCLVMFPDGQQHWVEMQYVAPG